MPRPSNTARRRAQIVEALRRLLPSSGFERTTVVAIAAEAGLAPGLVHYHFDNKREILLALLEELRDGIR